MLSDTAIRSTIRAAKTAQKPIKRFDQGGLFLLATPSGGALWRFKFKFEGREKLIGLGRFPDVPLKRAREKRDEARKLVADGKDPSAERQAAKSAQADSLEHISREWLTKQEGAVSAGTLKRDRRRLEAFVLPYLGKRPIKSVTPPELLATLRRIETRGHRETAHRSRLC